MVLRSQTEGEHTALRDVLVEQWGYGRSATSEYKDRNEDRTEITYLPPLAAEETSPADVA